MTFDPTKPGDKDLEAAVRDGMRRDRMFGTEQERRENTAGAYRQFFWDNWGEQARADIEAAQKPWWRFWS